MQRRHAGAVALRPQNQPAASAPRRPSAIQVACLGNRQDAAGNRRRMHAASPLVLDPIAGVVRLLAGLGLLAIPGIGPVVAAGWLASTPAVPAAGGLIGALTRLQKNPFFQSGPNAEA